MIPNKEKRRGAAQMQSFKSTQLSRLLVYIDRTMQNRSTRYRDRIIERKKVQYALFAQRVWIQIRSPLRPVSCSIFQCIQARDAQNDVDL
jgi:hypothetical protein